MKFILNNQCVDQKVMIENFENRWFIKILMDNFCLRMIFAFADKKRFAFCRRPRS